MHEFQLSESALEQWHEDGYLVTDLVIDGEVLERMAGAFARVFHGQHRKEKPFIVSWQPGDPEDRIRQMAFAWRVDPVLEASALTTEIGALAAQLTHSTSIRLLMDWIIHKPGIGTQPSPNTGVGFHQDQAYWLSTHPARLLTARIPLDDETVENGCMVVVPGSHKHELVPGLGNGFWTHGESGLEPGPGFSGSSMKAPRACELQRGQVMFHHCMLIHGSGQNRSTRPRRSQNLHMMPGDTRYRTGYGTFFSDYAALHGQKLEDGQLLAGPLFPEIFKRRWENRAQRRIA